MNKLILKLIYLYVLLTKIRFWKILNLKKKRSENIIWIYQSYPKGILIYLLGNSFLNDLALINAFCAKNLEFELVIGPKIGMKSGRHIFYTITKEFNIFQLQNHASSIINIIAELESQGNTLYPSLHELKYWENKSHMHKQFEILGIHTPNTIIVSSKEQFESIQDNLIFPCLMKECNSAGSLGVHKVNNLEELVSLVEIKMEQGISEFLIQELIDMRKDLRVILVGDKIVLHYWRLNEDKEWKPTSTGHGSKVDFISFPESWREEIVNSIGKLGLRTGAFDITWNEDDLNTKPIILEVSPAYMPNPPIPKKYTNISYSSYKRKLTFASSYPKEYIEIVFSIKRLVVNSYLKYPKDL